MAVTTVEELIQNCTQLIQRDDIVAGVGKRMCYPMLSVFLGKDAEAHVKDVQSAYFSCWSAPALKLTAFRGTYTQEQIENALMEACTVENTYHTKTTVRVAWYWDIMDDDFETHFNAINMEIHPPIGVNMKRTIFVFCSQRNSIAQKIAQERLQKLIAWGEQQKQPLFLFSDATMAGPLDRKGVAESYHMAASLVLLLNSEDNDAHDMSLANRLDFDLSQHPLWTMSYRACGKNFFDILGVSLVKIIEEYQKMGTTAQNNNGAQVRVCGENGDYITFLDDVFENIIAPCCPNDQEAVFWGDLPYTPEMAAMEQYLEEQPPVTKSGFFGFLSKKQKSVKAATDPIPSLGVFWDLCVQAYYIQPVRQWMSSSQGHQSLKEYMYGKLTKALTLADMQTQLPDERIKLGREQQYQNLSLPFPAPRVGLSLAAHLHACACTEVKRSIYKELLTILSEIMKELYEYSGTFTPLLENVANSFRGLGMDHNIQRAYGDHMKRLVRDNPEILNRKLRPCGSEAKLLEQLGNTFAALLEQDSSKIYHCTLQQNINFQIQAGAAADANNIIENFFSFNLKSAGRLVTSQVMDIHNEQVFCIMNDNLDDLIRRDYDIGTKFIVNRCDRIERLCIYPVMADAIC